LRNVQANLPQSLRDLQSHLPPNLRDVGQFRMVIYSLALIVVMIVRARFPQHWWSRNWRNLRNRYWPTGVKVDIDT
jgi:hypothetical protein